MGFPDRSEGRDAAVKLELSPRLEAIAGLVPEGCGCLADIGTDHGYEIGRAHV